MSCQVTPVHTNAFLELNGVPYLLAEYLDKNTFQQIDRSAVKSEVVVDQSEAMRSVINIMVDDIGIRASDGLLNVRSNNVKQRDLITAITNNYGRLDHQLDVLKRGIVLRINYQLENTSTCQVIRSMSEDIHIDDRTYFIDINSQDVNNNAIVVNFSGSAVSTVNEFTHGRDRMLIRIKSVQMFYECLGKNKPMMPPYVSTPMLNTTYGPAEIDYYNYHRQCNQTHNFDCGMHDMYGAENWNTIAPQTWTQFNRYYHFDNGGRDLILHSQEINDIRNSVLLIPCNSIYVNRTFIINPGQRLIFNFSIWKNDVIVVSDTTRVAQALHAPSLDMVPMAPPPPCDCHMPCDPVPPEGTIVPDYENLIRMMHDCMKNVNRQNFVINQISNSLQFIQGQLEDLTGSAPGLVGTKACSVGNDIFQTVQEAITAIENNMASGEINLANDVEEYLTVRGNVTINLNGHTIKAPAVEGKNFYHTIFVDGGNLTINGDGVISNDNEQGYCVMNASATETWKPSDVTVTSMGEGTIVLNGGTYLHKSSTKKGYVIVNHGASLTINELVSVDTEDDGSSLVCNGFMSSSFTSQPVMTINGGTFRGGRHTINNDHGGRMIINGGTFTMGTPWPDVNFASGPKNVFRNEATSTAKIKGGKFVGNVENSNTTEGALQISGGTFSADVSDWIVEGKKQERDGSVIDG